MAVLLHVVNSYFAVPYFIGGQFIYFKNKGLQIHLICPESEYLEDYSREMEFTYHNVEITRTYSLIKDLQALFSIIKYLRKNRVNIIVGHTPKGGLLAMLAGFICRVPRRIYFRHGLVYETSSGISKRVLALIEKITAFFSNDVICVSPSLYQVSLRDRLNPERKQSLLAYGTCGGIDTINKFNPLNLDQLRLLNLRERYKINNGDLVIGFCGRLVRDKGTVELVEAFEILRKRITGRKIMLLLVGLLDERDHLPEQIIKKIKTDDNIVYTDFINRDIQYYYAMMDIFILPSYREGFGMSVIEASAMEIPVLTSKSTGCIDSIVENVTGKYIEISACSIADAIESYMLDPAQAKILGKNGREFVKQRFDNLIVWKELERFYC